MSPGNRQLLLLHRACGTRTCPGPVASVQRCRNSNARIAHVEIGHVVVRRMLSHEESQPDAANRGLAAAF